MAPRSLAAVVVALGTAFSFAAASFPAEAHGSGGRGGGGGYRGGGHVGGGWHGGGGARIAQLSGGHVPHATLAPRVPVYAPGLSAFPHRPYVAPIVRPIVPVAPAYVAPRYVAVPPVVGYGYGYGYPYVPPAVVYTPPPVTYIEQQPQPQQLWYYCADYQAYYPNVEQCPSEWITVPATN